MDPDFQIRNLTKDDIKQMSRARKEQETENGNGATDVYLENYEKIFEFFADVSNDKFRRQMSSGIGLSLCKSIAESHKGKIFVTSELNTGSTFTFKIPINM